MLIFVSFSLVTETLRSNSLSFLTITVNFSCFVHFLTYVACIAHFGSSLTKEARKAFTTFSRMINVTAEAYTDTRKIDLIFALAQLKARNLSIQNEMFVIDWRVFVSVSSEEIKKN